MNSYRPYLERLSARTKTPLGSLVVSFGILHEVTALAPLVGVFFGARALRVGDRALEMVPADWVVEGEEWAGRVGRRYGIFGVEKSDQKVDPVEKSQRVGLAGDVANAVVAYAVVKASRFPFSGSNLISLLPGDLAPSHRAFDVSRPGILQARGGPVAKASLASQMDMNVYLSD